MEVGINSTLWRFVITWNTGDRGRLGPFQERCQLFKADWSEWNSCLAGLELVLWYQWLEGLKSGLVHLTLSHWRVSQGSFKWSGLAQKTNARNPLSYSIIILPTWSGWQHHVVGKSLSLGVLRPLAIEQSSFANAAQRCWAGRGEAEHQPMSLERWWFSNLSAPFLGKPVRDQLSSYSLNSWGFFHVFMTRIRFYQWGVGLEFFRRIILL